MLTSEPPPQRTWNDWFRDSFPLHFTKHFKAAVEPLMEAVGKVLKGEFSKRDQRIDELEARLSALEGKPSGERAPLKQVIGR